MVLLRCSCVPKKRLKRSYFRCVRSRGETRLEAYILDFGLGLEPTVLSFCLRSPPRTRASERAPRAWMDGHSGTGARTI